MLLHALPAVARRPPPRAAAVRLSAQPAARRTRQGEELLVVAISLAMSSGIVLWNVLRDGLPLSLDSSSQYWPWYAYLGDQLRYGHLPEWNPSAFGGVPFAGDPLSGWTYLPAMLFFTVLPTDTAIVAFMIGHMLLAGAAMYALARVLELRPPAALLTASLYAYSGFFQFHTVAAQPYVGVAAWLPVGLLGSELAIRSQSTDGRLRGWALAGLAVSQTVAIWPGQGSYYGVLLFAVWTFMRAVRVAPRFAVAHVAVPLVIGVALDAAALLPRLELQSLSNLADGYPQTELVGGWNLAGLVRLVAPSGWHLGAVAIGLSVVGLAAATRRPRSQFILAGLLWASGLILASSTETPLHTLLFKVLPGFQRLHPHVAERVLIVTYFAPALLAGCGLQVLMRRFPHPALPWAIASLVAFELLVAGRAGIDGQVGARWDGLARVDSYSAAFASTTAARFLAATSASIDGPYRYVGYAPFVDGQNVPYTQRFAEPATRALLVNNRAITLGLEDVQGYNAIHLARFDAFLRAVNAGRTQNYHDGQVFAPGADSPLLDLLGVRFVVVPSNEPSGRFQTVFQDSDVRVLEHSDALPRSWLVHHAQVATTEDALRLINTGAVDPRLTVVLEEPPLNATADYVVFNQIAYPGWVAYLDGRPTQPLAADGVLQAVATPPGTQTIELRFESGTLRLGLAISGAALAILAVLLIGTVRRTGRREQLPGTSSPGET